MYLDNYSALWISAYVDTKFLNGINISTSDIILIHIFYLKFETWNLPSCVCVCFYSLLQSERRYILIGKEVNTVKKPITANI
jgi:hypothetical protein